jgi:hypothetical protein
MALHLRTHPTPVDGCFGCKALSVSVGFHFIPGGKEEFHGPTIVERQKNELKMAEMHGNKIEPVHTRANVWAPV